MAIERLSVESVVWCAENSWPFAIVTDQPFRNIVVNGSPERQLPTPAQISWDIKSIIQGAEEHLTKQLKVCQCSSVKITCSQTRTRLSRVVSTSRQTAGHCQTNMHSWASVPIIKNKESRSASCSTSQSSTRYTPCPHPICTQLTKAVP